MRLNLRFLTVGGLAAVLSLAMLGCQQSNQSVQAAREPTATPNAASKALSDSDRTFITKAEKGNIDERNLGRLVLEKSRNKDVRDYAQMLVNDHTKALDDLVDLMNIKSMRQPKGLAQSEKESESELSGLSGTAFDREFINMMVDDHQKAVAEFRQEQNTAQDNDVKNYAAHVLPVLQKHLQKAQELQGKIAGGANTE